uniref:Uncharacterized protein n=1 Tax=Plectus sambesii TaxID=2011161 RepID=A0A914UTB0_9BILA
MRNVREGNLCRARSSPNGASWLDGVEGKSPASVGVGRRPRIEVGPFGRDRDAVWECGVESAKLLRRSSSTATTMTLMASVVQSSPVGRRGDLFRSADDGPSPVDGAIGRVHRSRPSRRFLPFLSLVASAVPPLGSQRTP